MSSCIAGTAAFRCNGGVSLDQACLVRLGLDHVDKHQLSEKVCPTPLSSAGFLSRAYLGKADVF